MSAHPWEMPLGSDADEGPPARRARHRWEQGDDDEAVPPLAEGSGCDDGDGHWGTYSSDSEDEDQEPDAATPGKTVLVSIMIRGTNLIGTGY